MSRSCFSQVSNLFLLRVAGLTYCAFHAFTPSASAQIGRQKGFDAVGGGSQSALSFAGDTGVAMRFYPAGSQPGYDASANFQSFDRSDLFRKLEGMEGSIWGQNIWAAQTTKEAQPAPKAEGPSTSAPRQRLTTVSNTRLYSPKTGVRRMVAPQRGASGGQSTLSAQSKIQASSRHPWHQVRLDKRLCVTRGALNRDARSGTPTLTCAGSKSVSLLVK